MSALIHSSRAPLVLSPSHPEWPTGLDALPDTPEAVHVAGTLPSLEQAVAIVGTRFADDEALGFTRKLAEQLASRGATIISGGARGVDAAAHEGALAAGGSTVAVLATGLVYAYPRAHAPLFSRITSAGALVCEASAAHHPRAFSFLRRNRLIAALASRVVVVQAPEKSGALSTAAWARRLGRPLWAVPCAPWDPRGLGCLGLLRQGADICTSAADVLSLRPALAGQLSLPVPGTGAATTSATTSGMTSHFDENTSHYEGLQEAHRRVLVALDRRGTHPDQLVTGLDMTAARVQEALLTLEMMGLVRREPDGLYVSVT